MARRRGLFGRIVDAVRNVFRPSPPPAPPPPFVAPPLPPTQRVEPSQAFPDISGRWTEKKQNLYNSFVQATRTPRIRDDPALQRFMHVLYLDRDRNLVRGGRAKAIKRELDAYLFRTYNLRFDDFFNWEMWREGLDT